MSESVIDFSKKSESEKGEFIERKIKFEKFDKTINVDRKELFVTENMITILSKENVTYEEIEEVKKDIFNRVNFFIKENDLSTEQAQLLIDAVKKVPGEIEAGFAPKAIIDFETGNVGSEFFPVARALERLGLRQGPSGVSIGIETSDGEIFVLQRSTKNASCKGFLGTVAGYISDRKDANTIGDLVEAEIAEQLDHEINLNIDEIEFQFGEVSKVDYPTSKEELLVSAKTSLTKAEILARMNSDNEGESGKLAEKNALWINPDQIINLLSDEDCHIATQHALAIALPLKNTEKWSQVLDLVKKLPKYSDKEVWSGLPDLLKKYEIEVPDSFFNED